MLKVEKNGKWNLNYLGCQLLCTWLPRKFKTTVYNTTVACPKAGKSTLRSTAIIYKSCMIRPATYESPGVWNYGVYFNGDTRQGELAMGFKPLGGGDFSK